MVSDLDMFGVRVLLFDSNKDYFEYDTIKYMFCVYIIIWKNLYVIKNKNKKL